MKVAAFVIAWGIYSEKSGDNPLSVKGYSAYWHQSLAQSYKERELFSIAFPEDKTPDRIWAAFRRLYGAKAASAPSENVSAHLLSIRGDFSGG
jgi:hypothetical protein